MKIIIENLGALRYAEFELGELTLVCGGNNTGKTYATYALFGFMFHWQQSFSIHISPSKIDSLLRDGAVEFGLDEYIQNAAAIVKEGCEQYVRQLPTVFAAPKERFKDTLFEVVLDEGELKPRDKYERRVRAAKADLFSITKSSGSSIAEVALLIEKEKVRLPRHVLTQVIADALKDILFGAVFPRPFIASAERTGAAIFRKELNFARNRLFDEMGQNDKNIDPIELLTKVYDDYALPVKTNVDFTRQLEALERDRSFLADSHQDILSKFANIIGGKYSVTKSGELYYVPSGKRIKLSMDESSSAVRSLLDVGFYLRHVVQPSDLLMIDEPELNLHPDNQRRVARLLVCLVNLGVKVFITTHSDYIVKELNTLIMLNQNKDHVRGIVNREGYVKEELLDANKVKVYIADEALVMLPDGKRKTRCMTLTAADVNSELGIEARSFDSTIADMNRIQDEIVWG